MNRMLLLLTYRAGWCEARPELAQVLDREGDALAIALHDAYLAGTAGQAGAARDDARHLHPLLLPFDALGATQREGVRAQVRTLADAIARTGRMIVRG